jgi:hypothetical protein
MDVMAPIRSPAATPIIIIKLVAGPSKATGIKMATVVEGQLCSTPTTVPRMHPMRADGLPVRELEKPFKSM